VWISPDIDISIQPSLVKVTGEVVIPEAAISPPKQTGVIAPSDDVQIVAGGESHAGNGSQQKVQTNVRITLGDKVSVDALGFKGSLLGSVLIEDDGSRATRATGSMKVAAGEYRVYGQDLTIERGSVIYSGGPVDNPGLDMRVTRVVDEVTAGAQISGTVSEPSLTLFSTPSMPESSLLSYLLFGRAPGTGAGASEQQLLMRAAAAMTMKGGNAIGEKLSESLNLDSIGLEGDSVQDTGVYIGKYLSPKLYVKYGMGLMEPTSTFFMRYILSKRWSVESISSASASGGDILYTLEH
jgi:translocation and assembly module TamB